MATNKPVARITAKPREGGGKALQLAAIWVSMDKVTNEPRLDKNGNKMYQVSFNTETTENSISLRDFIKSGGSGKEGSFFTNLWLGDGVTLVTSDESDSDL